MKGAPVDMSGLEPVAERVLKPGDGGFDEARALWNTRFDRSPASTTERLVGAGAALLAVPTETPWRSLNSRLEAPAGLQITLFEELEDAGD